MEIAQGKGTVRPRTGAGRAVTWIAIAVLACLSVLLVNGRPLFYFDTVGYIAQGHSALWKLGFPAESPISIRSGMVPSKTGGTGVAEPDLTEIEADHTVDGSRSSVYAVLAGTLARLGFLEGLIVLNVAAVLVAVWLPMRLAARRWGLHMAMPQAVAIPIIVACFGSLPFFVAYLMPDTFAPVLLLVIATLTVFARQMRPWEMLLALALGSLAIVSHLSHLAIAAVTVPFVVLVSLFMSRRQWWLPPALVLLIVGVGFAEQSVLRSAARTLSDSEVVIKPYITARLIQDGPGMRYLETHCPDETIPTCLLYNALTWSDDPYRLTASHIVFERSARLGSFRLMTPENQKIVADNQIGFFFDVLKDAPLATTAAFVRNVFIQAGFFSIEMTLPDEHIIAQNAGVTGLLSGDFDNGRITADTSWLGVVTALQTAVYVASLIVILVLVAAPRRVPVEVKALAIMALVGILANALVCGGISQPATRYGARVIWLLPLVATILVIFARRSHRFDRSAGEHA